MRQMTYVLIAAASLAVGVSTSAQQDMVKTHIGHVTTAFQGTPTGQGLLPTALAEAKIAAQHAALAMKSEGNLDGMKLHAGHVINAVDPSVEANGPGLKYGVKRAAAGVAQHIELAAKAEGASKNVMTHSVHVATSAGNVATWADDIVATAQQVRSATDAKVAAEHVAHLNMLAQQLVAGVDANKDGQTGWQAGEGGLQQAETHMNLLLKGEGQ
ncbi:MAG: hypothetical protein HY824_16940 [Acidobacteria bacterium]|nr:hypothetical protein [Acidobacteriota bacterium]